LGLPLALVIARDGFKARIFMARIPTLQRKGIFLHHFIMEVMASILLLTCCVLGINCEQCVDGYWGNPVNGGNCSGKNVQSCCCFITLWTNICVLTLSHGSAACKNAATF